jgi:hypothetical protein
MYEGIWGIGNSELEIGCGSLRHAEFISASALKVRP